MPDEFTAILKRGEGVFTPAQMRALGGGGGVNVTINNAPHGTTADVKKTRTGNQVDIDIALRRIVDDRIVQAAADPNHPFNHQLGAMGLDRTKGMG
jgi:hypothetical protein